MVAVGVTFDLYSGNHFDKVFVRFNSVINFRSCMCWFSFSLFSFFFFPLQECTMCVCVGVPLFPLINL